MSANKKGNKSKFITEELNDFMSGAQFIKESPKLKKGQKRPSLEMEEEDFSKLIDQYPTNLKKKKVDTSIDAGKESRQKLLDVMSQQLISRKQCNDRMLKSLSEVLTQLEVDYNVLKENEQKLEQLTGALIKCIQQATTAHKQKLKSLKDIFTAFKKEVEGLLTKGAMKPDDRPLWYDIYKAFPPKTEPKYARPPPEIKPIRQILYKEDVLRSKFHSQGHGLGAVNLLNTEGETHTKKLIVTYNKLKSEGVPEDELIEKSVKTLDAERKLEYQERLTPQKTTDTVSSQILSEANLENIFNEK